eukprot:6060879-Pleurochrysis_carterae.AAC.1
MLFGPQDTAAAAPASHSAQLGAARSEALKRQREAATLRAKEHSLESTIRRMQREIDRQSSTVERVGECRTAADDARQALTIV